MNRTVLVVEDDRGVRQFLKVFLETEGLAVSESWTIADALRQCAGQRFDLLILDYNLSATEIGWSIAGVVRADPVRYGSPAIIAMSGTVHLDAVDALGVQRSHFAAFLQKPFDTEQLRKLVLGEA